MIRWYFAWISRVITHLEHRDQYLLVDGGRMSSILATILAMLPVWLVGIAVYMLPFSDGIKFTLWILLLIATIIYALRTAWVLSRENNRKY